jgi:hypothetical protein
VSKNSGAIYIKDVKFDSLEQKHKKQKGSWIENPQNISKPKKPVQLKEHPEYLPYIQSKDLSSLEKSQQNLHAFLERIRAS